jgi:hypothetical protein
VYFAVPPTSWGTNNDEPADLERFESNWWKQWGGNLVYVVGNSAMMACYIFVLKMWMNAQAQVLGKTAKCRNVLLSVMFLYFFLNLLLVVLYLFVPYSAVLTLSAVGNMVITASIAAAYLWAWLSIWSALDMAAQRPRWTLLLCGDGIEESTVALLAPSDTEHMNVHRARHLLTRITRVCVCFTVGAVVKVIILAYMIYSLLANNLKNLADLWWAIIFVDYFIAEIVSAAVILYLMRKRKAVPSMDIQAAVA